MKESWETKLEDLIALCDLLNRSTADIPNRISDIRKLILQTVHE